MGLEDAVLDAGTGEVGLRFVDAEGRTVTEVPAGENDTDGATAEMEILRGELSRILYEHTRVVALRRRGSASSGPGWNVRSGRTRTRTARARGTGSGSASRPPPGRRR